MTYVYIYIYLFFFFFSVYTIVYNIVQGILHKHFSLFFSGLYGHTANPVELVTADHQVHRYSSEGERCLQPSKAVVWCIKGIFALKWKQLLIAKGYCWGIWEYLLWWWYKCTVLFERELAILKKCFWKYNRLSQVKKSEQSDAWYFSIIEILFVINTSFIIF